MWAMKNFFLILGVFFIYVAVLAVDEAIPAPLINVKFHQQPCIKPHDGYNYLTCHDILVSVNETPVHIPKNYNTNLASIPRWFWIFISPAYSGLIPASILHDYLYECPNQLTRREIDDIFYYALLGQEVSHYNAYMMYFAVRVFGASHFSEGAMCKDNNVYDDDFYKG